MHTSHKIMDFFCYGKGMPTPTHTCPLCHAEGLKCRRTQPDYSSAEHDLEMARTSVWECPHCKARFMLITPAGSLVRIGGRRK